MKPRCYCEECKAERLRAFLQEVVVELRVMVQKVGPAANGLAAVLKRAEKAMEDE